MSAEPLMSKYSSFVKFISFLLILFATLLFANLLGILLAIPFFGKEFIFNPSLLSELSNPRIVIFFKFSQLLSQLGMLAATILFAYLVNKNIPDYLCINKAPRYFSLILVFILILISIPFINWLSYINEQITFPHYFAGMESTLKDLEEKNNTILEAFLKTETLSGLFLNVLFIGLMTAIVEEFAFRGVLLRIFSDWTKNKHISVFITAIVFAAIHLQFYKIIPMFMMGILLGYLFVWSRSLWLPVFAHFFNNAMSIIFTYYYNKKVFGNEMETIGSKGNEWVYVLISGLTIAFLLFTIYSLEKRKSKFQNEYIKM